MVYLVDDDADDIEIVQEAMRSYSYKGSISVASNGQMLLDNLRSTSSIRPDVIVLDLNMPLRDGFEALKEIKSNSALKHIPVIVLTASSKKEDELRCFELGCDFFYNKPITFDGYGTLVTLVKQIIARKN
jgi:CheY-like chemotaxis protein